MTPVLLSTQKGTALHRPEPPPVGGQHVARRLSVACGLGAQLLAVPFAENQRACPAKLRDLLPSRRKRPPAPLADWSFAVFIDQEHTLLLPSVPHCRRTVFRAASAPVSSNGTRPGSKPPCLSTFWCVFANSFPFCELHVKDTYRKQTTPTSGPRIRRRNDLAVRHSPPVPGHRFIDEVQRTAL